MAQSGKPAVDADGWFDTGDVASIDKDSYMQIRDRVKDVVKSGGEWISSIELENAAVGHPEVAEVPTPLPLVHPARCGAGGACVVAAIPAACLATCERWMVLVLFCRTVRACVAVWCDVM